MFSFFWNAGRTIQPRYRLKRVLSASQLRATLEHERMRCDRNSPPFSLVTIRQSAAKLSNDQWEALLRFLDLRLRATDQFGLMNADRVGVILTATPIAGARTVVERICEALKLSDKAGIEIFVYPFNVVEDDSADPPAERLDELFHRPLPAWKRCLDIGGAVTGFLLLWPIMLVAVILVRLTSRGPALFAQKREGLGGSVFTMYKFRSMKLGAEGQQGELRQDSEQDGPAFKISNDPRVTWVGRYLRKTCIDELPQLWNVLRGDMSLVGPRPLPVQESSECLPWHRRRLHVTPGLTCIWQAHGGTVVTFNEWMRMDLRYGDKRSIFGDLRLIVRTIVNVVLHRAST